MCDSQPSAVITAGNGFGKFTLTTAPFGCMTLRGIAGSIVAQFQLLVSHPFAALLGTQKRKLLSFLEEKATARVR